MSNARNHFLGAASAANGNVGNSLYQMAHGLALLTKQIDSLQATVEEMQQDIERLRR